MSNNYGIPIVFDELSSTTLKDTTGLLYSIAEGQGRQRSNVHGEVKAPKNWGTSVISTSEYSIFNDSAQNDGLRVEPSRLMNNSLQMRPMLTILKSCSTKLWSCFTVSS